MTDITATQIYGQIKAILEGCDTIVDAMPFCTMYADKYPAMRDLIMSLMNGKNYKDNVDIKTKQTVLKDINFCETKEDALSLITKLEDKSTDDVYKRTMERLSRKKHSKQYSKKEVMNNNISKKCPHCFHMLYMPANTTYVICGYHNTNSGYDWNGCGRDWCFSCGKMLCKKWEIDSLNLQMNQSHDDECCELRAQLNGHNYLNDYCQCNNIHVHRDLNNVLKAIMR
jgi:hypothetical protein